MKRIIIITTDNFPYGMASAYRILCYSLGFAKLGNNVTVIASSEYNQIKNIGFYIRSVYKGINVINIFNLNIRKNKILLYLFWSLRSLLILLHTIINIKKYDIIFIYRLAIIDKLILILVSKCFNVKVLLELNEYPYIGESNGILKSRIVKSIFQKFVFYLNLKFCNGIIVISENLKLIADKYAPNVKKLKVPILTLNEENENCSSNVVYNSLSPYILHAGTLTIQKDGILDVVRAFIKASIYLRNEHQMELKFIVTNKKCTNEIWYEIQRLLGAVNLGSNFICAGYLDRNELNNYINNASLFLINKPNSVQNIFNFPTKISDYLNSGNPVIVAAEGLELNNFLRDGVNAIVVKPNDINEMSNAIIKLTLDASFSQKLGSAGKLLAREKLDYMFQANRIIEFIKDI